jgi:hypothetical protein
MIATSVPDQKEDCKELWQEAKELNLIFNKIYSKTK